MFREKFKNEIHFYDPLDSRLFANFEFKMIKLKINPFEKIFAQVTAMSGCQNNWYIPKGEENP